ncbi:hypothetical protein FRB90_000942 [Tulasnella sp. 427]|nr:hypothetical protein FRB90_000942 [Tulasnella sp. 427]
MRRQRSDWDVMPLVPHLHRRVVMTGLILLLILGLLLNTINTDSPSDLAIPVEALALLTLVFTATGAIPPFLLDLLIASITFPRVARTHFVAFEPAPAYTPPQPKGSWYTSWSIYDEEIPSPMSAGRPLNGSVEGTRRCVNRTTTVWITHDFISGPSEDDADFENPMYSLISPLTELDLIARLVSPNVIDAPVGWVTGTDFTSGSLLSTAKKIQEPTELPAFNPYMGMPTDFKVTASPIRRPIRAPVGTPALGKLVGGRHLFTPSPFLHRTMSWSHRLLGLVGDAVKQLIRDVLAALAGLFFVLGAMGCYSSGPRWYWGAIQGWIALNDRIETRVVQLRNLVRRLDHGDFVTRLYVLIALDLIMAYNQRKTLFAAIRGFVASLVLDFPHRLGLLIIVSVVSTTTHHFQRDFKFHADSVLLLLSGTNLNPLEGDTVECLRRSHWSEKTGFASLVICLAVIFNWDLQARRIWIRFSEKIFKSINTTTPPVVPVVEKINETSAPIPPSDDSIEVLQLREIEVFPSTPTTKLRPTAKIEKTTGFRRDGKPPAQPVAQPTRSMPKDPSWKAPHRLYASLPVPPPLPSLAGIKPKPIRPSPPRKTFPNRFLDLRAHLKQTAMSRSSSSSPGSPPSQTADHSLPSSGSLSVPLPNPTIQTPPQPDPQPAASITSTHSPSDSISFGLPSHTLTAQCQEIHPLNVSVLGHPQVFSSTPVESPVDPSAGRAVRRCGTPVVKKLSKGRKINKKIGEGSSAVFNPQPTAVDASGVRLEDITRLNTFGISVEQVGNAHPSVFPTALGARPAPCSVPCSTANWNTASGLSAANPVTGGYQNMAVNWIYGYGMAFTTGAEGQKECKSMNMDVDKAATSMDLDVTSTSMDYDASSVSMDLGSGPAPVESDTSVAMDVTPTSRPPPKFPSSKTVDPRKRPKPVSADTSNPMAVETPVKSKFEFQVRVPKIVEPPKRVKSMSIDDTSDVSLMAVDANIPAKRKFKRPEKPRKHAQRLQRLWYDFPKRTRPAGRNRPHARDIQGFDGDDEEEEEGEGGLDGVPPDLPTADEFLREVLGSGEGNGAEATEREGGGEGGEEEQRVEEGDGGGGGEGGEEGEEGEGEEEGGEGEGEEEGEEGEEGEVVILPTAAELMKDIFGDGEEDED